MGVEVVRRWRCRGGGGCGGCRGCGGCGGLAAVSAAGVEAARVWRLRRVWRLLDLRGLRRLRYVCRMCSRRVGHSAATADVFLSAAAEQAAVDAIKASPQRRPYRNARRQ